MLKIKFKEYLRMDAVYYIASNVMPIIFLALITFIIIFLAKPHLLNNRKVVKSPFSRFKIVLVGVAAIVLTLFSFGSVMAATEPLSVKQARSEAAAKVEAVRSAEAAAKQKLIDDSKAAFKKQQEEDAKPQVKTETDVQSTAFLHTQEETASLPKGQTKSSVAGVKGERTITYLVTYVNGKETARSTVKDEVTKPPVDEVTQIGTYVAPAPARVSAPTPASSHNSVRIGATCRDGSHSNATGSGACSHHHGVAYWLYN